MTLIRWNPDRSLSTLPDVDRLFDNFFTRGLHPSSAPLAPAVDIEESPDAFVFRADLPGLDPKDVKVKLEGDVLSVRGERKRESLASDGHSHRVERSFGAFERSFTLNAPVRGDKIEASYAQGVLEVRVPKADEAKAREIEVQVR